MFFVKTLANKINELCFSLPNNVLFLKFANQLLKYTDFDFLCVLQYIKITLQKGRFCIFLFYRAIHKKLIKI